MTMTRGFKRLICRGLIGLMLFTQFAVASYACSGLSGASAPAQTASATHDATGDDMTGMAAQASGDLTVTCDQMVGSSDTASPGMCAQHCHNDQQSSHADVPVAPAVALVSLYTVAPTVLEATPPMSATAASVDSVAMAPPPPHAILHCCIRD